MNRYKIADLTVDINFRGELLKRRSEKYKIEYDKSTAADIVIDISPDEINKRVENSKANLDYDSFEYMMTGTSFYRSLIKFGGFMLHASAVALDNKAYLFSAPCGTGKSTHTALWEEYFKSRGAYVINDDKPAIRIGENDEFFVYGTPWSGKSDKNVNSRVPLGAICFLERSEINCIEKLGVFDSIQKLVWQTIRPSEKEDLSALLSLQDKLIQKYGIYKMGCKIDYDAVELAYKTMNTDKEI